MHVCTSFSPKKEKEYGLKFIESWKRHSDVPLFVFYEGSKPNYKGVELIPLDEDKDRKLFLEKFKDNSFVLEMRKLFEKGKWYQFEYLRFCHKVFAMTWPERPQGKWIWCDADVFVFEDLTSEWWSRAAPDGFVCSYLGRMDRMHSETGWIAFNGEDGRKFGDAMRDCYVSGDIFRLPGFTDSFVFDALREDWKSKGYLFKNLSEGIFGTDVWPFSVLGESMIHYKGRGRTRYQQLLPIIRKVKPKTILEIGIWYGETGLAMIQEALRHQKEVNYIGYDLFDDLTEEIKLRENATEGSSKLELIKQRFDQAKKIHPGLSYQLVKGDTRTTLSEIRNVDFALVDGGKSIETIASDLKALKDVPVVVVDGFYEREDSPDIEKFGINKLIEGKEEWHLLELADELPYGGTIRMAVKGLNLFQNNDRQNLQSPEQ